MNQGHIGVVGNVREFANTDFGITTTASAFDHDRQDLISNFTLAAGLVRGNNANHLVGLAVGRQRSAKGPVVNRATTRGIGKGSVVVISHVDDSILNDHIVCPVGMIDLRCGNLLGIDSNVARGSSETNGILDFRLTVVGHLLATITTGNHITQLVGLTNIAIDKTIAGLVHDIQGRTSLVQHGSIITQDNIGVVGDASQCTQTDTFTREHILGSHHRTYLTIQGRNGLDGHVAAHGEGSAVLL